MENVHNGNIEIISLSESYVQKHNTICVGHNHAQANTNNLNPDTWLTVAEYLCYTSPRICPVLLSSSGEEIYYHSDK
jgi:hypothetical protein